MASALNMEEYILKVFSKSTLRYFDAVAGAGAVLGTPYLGGENESAGLGFSAVIGISGSYRGNIYYTASREMLNAVLPLLGEKNPDEQLCAELVGEVTNTISGNAREQLGGGFMISTPLILQGKPLFVRPTRGVALYVLPITWRQHASRLLIAITKEDSGDSETIG
jgi:chemotaxis protein CheX